MKQQDREIEEIKRILMFAMCTGKCKDKICKPDFNDCNRFNNTVQSILNWHNRQLSDHREVIEGLNKKIDQLNKEIAMMRDNPADL